MFGEKKCPCKATWTPLAYFYRDITICEKRESSIFEKDNLLFSKKKKIILYFRKRKSSNFENENLLFPKRKNLIISRNK